MKLAIPCLALIVATVACQPTESATSLRYSGSSTIGEHVMPRAASGFQAESGYHFAAIAVPGSNRGLADVAAGKADVAGVSRALSAAEQSPDTYFVIIGYDALGVFVHAENPVQNLTLEQLRDVFTGGVTNWKELGGLDLPVRCITEKSSAERATLSVFRREVLEDAPYRHDCVEVDRPADQVTSLVATPGGVISVSVAFAQPGIKPLTIDGIGPEEHHVLSGAYPVSRPLLLVTRGVPHGAAGAFVEFMVGPRGQEVVAERFVSLREVLNVRH